MNQHTIKRDPDGIEPDALTSDPDVRIRQLSLVLYSARVAAEKASGIYASAIRKMRAAEIQLARAVNERRRSH
jgi:hypothetical protein